MCEVLLSSTMVMAGPEAMQWRCLSDPACPSRACGGHVFPARPELQCRQRPLHSVGPPGQLLQHFWGLSAWEHPYRRVGLVSCRRLETELRTSLQQEEARLEQARAQSLRNQELLLLFENGIDNLFIRLYGIDVPDQVQGAARSWGPSCHQEQALPVPSPEYDPWQCYGASP